MKYRIVFLTTPPFGPPRVNAFTMTDTSEWKNSPKGLQAKIVRMLREGFSGPLFIEEAPRRAD